MHELAPHHGFQYASAERQADTAMAGMWLFLASEVLFFGGLFFAYLVSRHSHADGFALATGHTNLAIGAVNTLLLLTSSAVYAVGSLAAEAGRPRLAVWTSLATAALGVLFVVLKGVEWAGEFSEHLFPGAGFALQGPDAGGAQIFYAFYFVATALHAFHMLVGVGLMLHVALLARRGAFDGGWRTPLEVVGLYWSFVDMVWLVLFPLIYLVGRA